ncbi:GNAT family N-acetyltransferase/peptidase C39 family protein [Stappia sp. ES.058]|uniref:GNAT family N-acetyltransferase/peptidase C39 family protein n=1 Tax=Stappia sp. ES.058 TaxID=1881061 RepID=UPI000879B719|nr:GNAT family N-acetyltransferase/peptidase C39 family protein [Stappia sp. ES.058]SDU21859.1 Ribosomal protein S18 acetylase RimI [Stappia sp. ES.058]
MLSSTSPDPDIRLARTSDLPELLRLENACFSGDRISRRSFRRFLESAGVSCLLAEVQGRCLGYALLLFRSGTAMARLYSLAVDPGARGTGLSRRLLAAAEADAFARERILLRLEVREDNAAARALYERAGYRRHGRVAAYYEDGAAAIRMEKLLHDEAAPPSAVPYFSQTSDFTCGPSCLMMALKHFGAVAAMDERLELRLWRETTTIYLASGHGGCGPFGMAVAAAHRGLRAEVRLAPGGHLFLSSVRDPDKRRVMETVQDDYRAEAAAMGIDSSGAPLTAAALAAEVAGGALAIVLISEYRMQGRRGPHWVLVQGQDARHVFIHDPWLGYEGYETPQDAANLPIPFAEFDRMARWGKPPVRAQILLKKA